MPVRSMSLAWYSARKVRESRDRRAEAVEVGVVAVADDVAVAEVGRADRRRGRCESGRREPWRRESGRRKGAKLLRAGGILACQFGEDLWRCRRGCRANGPGPRGHAALARRQQMRAVMRSMSEQSASKVRTWAQAGQQPSARRVVDASARRRIAAEVAKRIAEPVAQKPRAHGSVRVVDGPDQRALEGVAAQGPQNLQLRRLTGSIARWFCRSKACGGRRCSRVAFWVSCR